MKGTTTIKMNKATMLDAVQMYVDSQFSEAHEVSDVQAVTSSGYGDNGCFEVTVKLIEQPAKTA